jgi:hypothetical protein
MRRSRNSATDISLNIRSNINLLSDGSKKKTVDFISLPQ